jgi:hypothetical protein
MCAGLLGAKAKKQWLGSVLIWPDKRKNERLWCACGRLPWGWAGVGCMCSIV